MVEYGLRLNGGSYKISNSNKSLSKVSKLVFTGNTIK